MQHIKDKHTHCVYIYSHKLDVVVTTFPFKTRLLSAVTGNIGSLQYSLSRSECSLRWPGRFGRYHLSFQGRIVFYGDRIDTVVTTFPFQLRMLSSVKRWAWSLRPWLGMVITTLLFKIRLLSTTKGYIWLLRPYLVRQHCTSYTLNELLLR